VPVVGKIFRKATEYSPPPLLEDSSQIAAPETAPDEPLASLHGMRNPIACVSCRSAKQKCIHDDSPPCERCQATGRADECEFPAPGTSSIHRRPKRPRIEDSTYGSTPPSSTALTSRTARSPASNAASLLEGLDPFDLLTDDVKNSYLRCSYKWSFHHTPTLLLRIRDRTLEPWMAWAILALAIR
jgi:hypothetical protein